MGDFINKVKHLKNIPEGAYLVIVDVVGLYPSNPHEVGLNVLGVALGNREHKSINTEDLIKMAEFVLKKTFLNLIGRLKNKYQERSLPLNLHQHMPVSSWTEWKMIFLIPRKMHL